MEINDLTKDDDEISSFAPNVRPASNFQQCRQGVRDQESSDDSDSAKSTTNTLAVSGHNILKHVSCILHK